MAKNKKDKKKNKKRKEQKLDAIGFLNKYKSDITVTQDGKEFTLEEISKKSASNTKAVPFDSIIPVSAEEAIKNKKVNFNMSASFSASVYKLFELGMASPKETCTLLCTIDAADVDEMFSESSSTTMGLLKNKSNLSLVLDNLDKKIGNMEKWAEQEPDDDFDMFVLTIPNLCMFKTKFSDDYKADAVFFNLCIQVVKGKKRISKVKRKGGELLETLCKFVVKCSMENIKDHGFSSVVIPAVDRFAEDYYAVIENWKIQLDMDDTFTKLVNSINFTVKDMTAFAIVSHGCNDFMEKVHKK